MNIVLIEPEIHWNTGNIGRTCAATGTALHLVGRLGFSLGSNEIKRSGLDYWPKLAPKVHKTFEDFRAGLGPEARLFFFSTKAAKSFWEAPYTPDAYLVFGSESAGLPAELHERYRGSFYRVPILKGNRSLNLSTAAGVVLYEGLRKTGFTAR